MNKLILPQPIEKLVAGMSCERNAVGMSQAGVYKFSSSEISLFLKIEPVNGELSKEHRALNWLKGRLPVPEIIAWESDGEHDFLLMCEVAGKMACDDYYLRRPAEAVALLANGLNILQAIDIAACPISNNLDIKLRDAEMNIRLGTVNVDDWEPENRFKSPSALLDYLVNNKPTREELSFTHGDFCLPNIFGVGEKLSGFIDLGRCGIADVWQDIALCIRSLRHNFGTDEYAAPLLDQIGVKMDEEKLNYYILLDELF